MSKAKITVFGFRGSNEELKQLLAGGLHITTMKANGSGCVIEYETEPKVGRPQKINKDRILALRAEGMAYAVIGKALGCSKAYVIKVCKAEAATEPVAVPEPLPEPPEALQEPERVDAEPEIPGQMSVEEFMQPSTPQKKSLKELRKAAGLTQKQLAEATGLKLRSIQDYENGKQGLKYAGPVARHLLAKALHCSIDDFEDYFYNE